MAFLGRLFSRMFNYTCKRSTPHATIFLDMCEPYLLRCRQIEEIEQLNNLIKVEGESEISCVAYREMAYLKWRLR